MPDFSQQSQWVATLTFGGVAQKPKKNLCIYWGYPAVMLINHIIQHDIALLERLEHQLCTV